MMPLVGLQYVIEAFPGHAHLHFIRLCHVQSPGKITQNGAVKCDFQQCGILKSVDSDEPVQPPFLAKKTPNDV